MVPILVLFEGLNVLVNGLGIELRIPSWQGQDFVSGCFNGSGLMDVDVPRFSRDDSLVLRQHCINNNLVGLGASGQKFNLSFWVPQCLLNSFLCQLGKFVKAIAGFLVHVGCH